MNIIHSFQINGEVGEDDDIEFLFEQKAPSPTPTPSRKRKSLSSATPAPSRRMPKTTITRARSMQPRAQHCASPLLLTKRSIGLEAPSEVPSTAHVPMLQAALIGQQREQMRRADSNSGLLSGLPPRASSLSTGPTGAVDSRVS